DLQQTDQIVGFLYIGTPALQAPTKPLKEGMAFARYL
ncbi:MAG: hypothetical protein ACI8SJ_002430, partial [Shewanella sp.]